MFKVDNIIKNTFLFIFAAMLPVGCQLEKDGPSVERESVMIEMNVTADQMTKALYEEDMENPTAMESVINTLRVYAFYGNALAGYTERQATDFGQSFYMDLSLPAEGSHKVDFYLVANEAEMALENNAVTLSENMTKSQLEALKFTSLMHRTSLPMYCRQEENVNVDNVTANVSPESGHEGHLILAQKVTFRLSRSLAKLSLYAAKVQGASSDPRIHSVELLAAGTREFSYLFPQTDEMLGAVNSRSNNRVLLNSQAVVTRSLVRGSAAAQDPANYTPVVNGVYLPEVSAGTDPKSASFASDYKWNVSSGDERAAVLHVEYSLGEGTDRLDGYIYLPRVYRNHHIKACILINAEGQIIVNYVVADWDWDEDKMQNWFFDYPTHSYLWPEIPLDNEELHKKPSSPAEMSEIKPFTGYFQMTYPESDRWSPTLEGLNASYCSVKVYNDRTGDLVFTTENPQQLSVSEDWYRIEVFPNPGKLDAGDVVNLAITYTPGGMTENEYLLINGAHLDYFWPRSSNENYVTITMVN